MSTKKNPPSHRQAKSTSGTPWVDTAFIKAIARNPDLKSAEAEEAWKAARKASKPYRDELQRYSGRKLTPDEAERYRSLISQVQAIERVTYDGKMFRFGGEQVIEALEKLKGWMRDEVADLQSRGAAVNGNELSGAELRRDAIVILQVLEAARPLPLTQPDIVRESHRRLRERTLSRRMSVLEQAGFVHRPNGPNSGYRLTPHGESWLAKNMPQSRVDA